MTDNKTPDQSVEQGSESTQSGLSEAVTNEAVSGKAELAKQQKDYIDYLKSGGRSGITEQFGKLRLGKTGEVSKPGQKESPPAGDMGEIPKPGLNVSPPAGDMREPLVDNPPPVAGDKGEPLVDNPPPVAGDMGEPLVDNPPPLTGDFEEPLIDNAPPSAEARIYISHRDGSRTVINSDQSQMTTDRNGRITTLTQADGDTVKFEYDENGNLKQLKLPDGGEWNKNKDGSWTRTNKDGKVVDNLDGGFEVTEDGDVIVLDNKDGYTVVSHLDGSFSYINPDQSQMTVNMEGQVISITQADGDTAKFEYDENGALNKVQLPDGGEWNKNKDGSWTRTDKDGKVVVELQGTLEVNNEGDVIMVDDVSGRIIVSHLDGSRTYVNPDSSQMTFDRNGNVVSATQADGDTAKFDYDDAGNISNMKLPDGGQWSRNEDGSYTRTDKDGNVVDKLDGTISVSEDGDVIYAEKDGNVQVSHLDGSKTFIYPDQSQLTVDRDGKVISVTQADGDTASFEYDQNGALSKMNLPDGGAWTKNEDGTWTRRDKDGKQIQTLDGEILVTEEGDVIFSTRA